MHTWKTGSVVQVFAVVSLTWPLRDKKACISQVCVTSIQVRCPMIPARGRQLFGALKTARGIGPVCRCAWDKGRAGGQERGQEERDAQCLLPYTLLPTPCFS